MAKYPNIEVQLTGQDGNAFNLLGIVQSAMRKNKVPQEEINKFLEEAMGGDYNNLLCTCCDWVSVH